MSTSRAPSQRHGLAFRLVPLLLAGSLRVTGGSPLLRAQRPPSRLRRCCQRLPFSEDFLPGARRASPVSVQPFPACCRHYPAGSGRGVSQRFRGRCCLRRDLRGSASRISPHEACTTFDSYGPQGRSPSQARVCQKAPPPPFGCEASPQLHGSGSCHVGTFTHWVVSTFLVTADPDMRVSRIRLLRSRIRCGTIDRMDDLDTRQRIPVKQTVELVPGHRPELGATIEPLLPESLHLIAEQVQPACRCTPELCP